jgi:hypothetical protein
MNKILTIIMLALYATGCQYFISRPGLIPQAEETCEDIFKDFQPYEHKTLSPTPPLTSRMSEKISQ